MFSIFNKTKSYTDELEKKNFNYLNSQDLYFDSACQTLRPYEVIQAINDYYTDYGSCGGRVSYQWGRKVDTQIRLARERILKLVGKSEKDYTVAFCLNATSGINLILQQLKAEEFEQITISENEHSSVFIPSITWSQKHNKARNVLTRDSDYNLEYSTQDLKNSIVLINSTNNYNGQTSTNLQQLAQDIHHNEGVFLLDACQTMGHKPEVLKTVDFDAVFASGHKMYGPSIGFMVVKKNLFQRLSPYMLGGSTISDNSLEKYDLIWDEGQLPTQIEAGLQNFAGIIGLSKAIEWKSKWSSKGGLRAEKYESYLAEYLNQKLLNLVDQKLLRLIYEKPSSVVSLYSEKLDSAKLGIYLDEKNIMCRTGYHCVYYYLKHQMQYPRLFRISLGLNNTKEQIDSLVEKLEFILKI